ncbi:hypothetical protein V2J09_013578 [Rumex salicifolius]
MAKKAKKRSTPIVSSSQEKTGADFLPLEGGPGRKLLKGEPLESKATVVYIGRIPHGFYEDEMEAFFKQFGTIKRLKIARNRKWSVIALYHEELKIEETGQSKHYGFIEFEYPEVAKIVAECMHNYLLFEHLLQVQLVPPEHVHPKLYALNSTLVTCIKASRSIENRFLEPIDFVLIERKKQNKQKTLEEYKKQIERTLKRDRKRRKKIDAAGIDYECPEIVGADQPALKKIKIDKSLGFMKDLVNFLFAALSVDLALHKSVRISAHVEVTIMVRTHHIVVTRVFIVPRVVEKVILHMFCAECISFSLFFFGYC